MRALFAVEAVDDQDSVCLDLFECAVESSLLLLTEELLVYHIPQLAREAKEVERSMRRSGYLGGMHRGQRKGILWRHENVGGGREDREREMQREM